MRRPSPVVIRFVVLFGALTVLIATVLGIITVGLLLVFTLTALWSLIG